MRSRRLAAGAGGLLLAACLLLPRLVPVPEWFRTPQHAVVSIEDRTGERLATYRPSEELEYVPVDLDRVDPLLIRATLAAEDRRFFRHPGVDPLAVARAVWIAVSQGRPLGGASTLSMQTVRLCRGAPRTFGQRLAEVGWAFVLEAHLSKREILEAYLNRAPYGGLVTGIGAAAQRWFGRPPSALSPAQAALLASLPRAPGRFHPLLHPEAACVARNDVLRRMVRLGWLDEEESTRAAESGLGLAAQPPSRAPHFVRWVRRRLEGEGPRAVRITTTLDPEVQQAAESALRRQIETLRQRNVRGGAVVVLDVRSSQVLALVGSPDFGSVDAGQVNAALALRQPGSAVKPFTYAVAFAGSLRPSTILADVPTSYEDRSGIFTPRNYDGTFAGPLSARMALANSRNVPSLDVLERTGLEAIARGFEAVGLPGVDIERCGLGITLGVREVSLLDLAAAYACLARGGLWIEPTAVIEAYGTGSTLPLRPASRRPALDAIACAWVNEILSDPVARAAAFQRGGPLEFPGPVAAKTGTSSDWRDAWAILYSSRHVVAAWMGNPDGSATDRVTGAQGPAVVAHEILAALEPEGIAEPFGVPRGSERRPVCPLSGRAAGADCPQLDWQPFRTEDPPLPPCTVHVRRTVDRASGLLARGCTPPERRETRVFIELPARFSFWQSDHALPRAPEALTGRLCGSAACGAVEGAEKPEENRPTDLAIVRPLDGTILAIDPTLPSEQQSLALEARAPPAAEVVWRVDGKTVGTTRGVHRLFWPLARGSHRIEAVIEAERVRATARVVVLQVGERIARAE